MPKCDNWMHEDSKNDIYLEDLTEAALCCGCSSSSCFVSSPRMHSTFGFPCKLSFSPHRYLDPMTRRIRDMSNNFEHFFARGVGV